MNHEETIFEQALSIGSAQSREAFLREACMDNDEMLQRLKGLLGAHDRAGKFLDHAQPGQDRSDPALSPTVATIAPHLSLTEKPGDRIGRYKLLQKIGE